MSSPTATNAVEPRRPKASGAEIRARIDANTRKRRAIAEQMKREAGVRGHLENRTDGTGSAWLHTGNIETPESRNIMNLYIVAHECGHVFMHSRGIGRVLPSHLKEYEAECYAHHALREHGMQVPWQQTARARAYVAEHIEADRIAGRPIDPRAEQFATRFLDPYQPLRMRPANWTRSPRPVTIDELYDPRIVAGARATLDALDALQRRARRLRWTWVDRLMTRLIGPVVICEMIMRLVSGLLQLGLASWFFYRLQHMPSDQFWTTEQLTISILMATTAAALYATGLIDRRAEQRRYEARMRAFMKDRARPAS